MTEVEIFRRYLALRDNDLAGIYLTAEELAEMQQLRETIKQIFEEKP